MGTYLLNPSELRTREPRRPRRHLHLWHRLRASARQARSPLRRPPRAGSQEYRTPSACLASVDGRDGRVPTRDTGGVAVESGTSGGSIAAAGRAIATSKIVSRN